MIPERHETGDERAVSPVIGTILMVAITVVLAATVGTFVLDIGSEIQDTGPQVAVGVDTQPPTTDSSEILITLTHQNGEELPLDQLSLQIRNESDNSLLVTLDPATGDTGDRGKLTGSDVILQKDGGDPSAETFFTATDTLQVSEDGANVAEFTTSRRYRILLVHEETGTQIVNEVVRLK